MKDSALPANPLDVDQVDFDNAEHRRAFYDALIASGRDKVMEDRRRLYEHKFIDEQGDPIPTSPSPIWWRPAQPGLPSSATANQRATLERRPPIPPQFR